MSTTGKPKKKILKFFRVRFIGADQIFASQEAHDIHFNGDKVLYLNIRPPRAPWGPLDSGLNPVSVTFLPFF